MTDMAIDLTEVASERILGRKNGVCRWFYSKDGNYVYIVGCGGRFFCKVSLDYEGFGVIFELLRKNMDKEVAYDYRIAGYISKHKDRIHNTERIGLDMNGNYIYRDTANGKVWHYPPCQLGFIKGRECLGFYAMSDFLLVFDEDNKQYFLVGAEYNYGNGVD